MKLYPYTVILEGEASGDDYWGHVMAEDPQGAELQARQAWASGRGAHPNSPSCIAIIAGHHDDLRGQPAPAPAASGVVKVLVELRGGALVNARSSGPVDMVFFDYDNTKNELHWREVAGRTMAWIGPQNEVLVVKPASVDLPLPS